MTPELAPTLLLLTTTPHPREDVSAVDRFALHDGSLVVLAQTRDKASHATRGLLVTNLVILKHGQVTRTTPELAPPIHHTNEGRALEHSARRIVEVSNPWVNSLLHSDG
ncbi:hypothetical protein TNCV_3460061 [Trichonephila clavipes]|nr:hypothetical protein TNCV_3460061 [Trichonephila clavipes]